MDPKAEAKGLGQPFHILYRSGQEALLAHVLDAEHASKAQAMIDLRFGKRTFNRFLAPIIDASPLRGLSEACNLIQRVLPDMSFHHPSRHALAKALCSSGALRTRL